MQQSPVQLIADFVEEILKIQVSIENVRHETLAPPHESLQLAKGSCAVYVFTLAGDPAICLKGGKVGAKGAPCRLAYTS